MELLIIIFLLLINGIFSMYETALVSSRKLRLQEKAKFGSIGAKTALSLLKEPEKILSAIQVGITLIGIIAGAYGGVALAEDVAPWFAGVPMLEPYADTLAIIIVVGFITYLSLIIGELVPKTIALNNSELIASFLSPAMKVLGSIAYPIVWFLSVSTKIVINVIGIKSKDEAPVTEEELRILLKQSSERGIIEKEESKIISEVIRFAGKRAGMIMTHRVDVEWIDITASNEEIIAKAFQSSYSKLPVCQGSVEEIKGMVTVKELLASYIKNKDFNINDILIEPLYLPAQLSAPKVLERFRNTKKHFGIVVDEYGSMLGLITLHNITENIMGDLPALEEADEPGFMQRTDGSYIVDGSLVLEDLRDLLGVRSLFEVDEEKTGINTIGGLAMYKLHHVPRVGDIFVVKGYQFEIVDLDGNRVDKLIIVRL